MKLKELQEKLPRRVNMKVYFKESVTISISGLTDSIKFSLENEVEMIKLDEGLEVTVKGFPLMSKDNFRHYKMVYPCFNHNSIWYSSDMFMEVI